MPWKSRRECNLLRAESGGVVVDNPQSWLWHDGVKLYLEALFCFPRVANQVARDRISILQEPRVRIPLSPPYEPKSSYFSTLPSAIGLMAHIAAHTSNLAATSWARGREPYLLEP